MKPLHTNVRELSMMLEETAISSYKKKSSEKLPLCFWKGVSGHASQAQRHPNGCLRQKLEDEKPRANVSKAKLGS
ncbi:hypothetical protein P7K49_022083 [Saguinus oedipus]|uniref:Uncharacterized protein n=1 Tax=Saguinus oedipus TaxID=9490 RepID=A0ABQ9UVB7_SAGOE|nr:hypothetical protein P7K49_022083 [Saguinus oedipus]